MRGNVMFPIFLKLEQLHTLIVGGGFVGEEKLGAILKHSPQAKVTLVADLIREGTRSLAEEFPNVELVNRKFEWSDLDEKDMVILATDSRKLHEEIKLETSKRHLLTNVADTPDLCDFYLGSVIKKGDLKIGISTNGKSPTLAKRMRELFEDIFPDDTQELLDNLEAYRAKLKGDFEYKLKALNELTEDVMRGK